uniref:Uncharacterized protein n=1 Tax=Arundo donax TaxID=35708 RepID=A0A0A9C0E3_ARUDO
MQVNLMNMQSFDETVVPRFVFCVLAS